MSLTLIIAEKPSVATDLARVLGKQLGKFKRDDSTGSHMNDDYIITSAVGHLVEQMKPQKEDGKNLPWKMEYLPVMPKEMKLEPIARSADKLRKILRLARRKDVNLIVNACDAGREGELIFRNIIRFGKIKKPIKRLWMQSMTDDSILESWGKLIDDESMQNLSSAAVCRSESDWLVGLNSTRALTAMQSAAGGFNITPTGRVQTPTLAILARRQKEVLAFIPEAYQEVHAQFAAAAGSYDGKWFDPTWKKDVSQPLRTKDRIWNPELAIQILERCQGQQAEVKESRKPVTQAAPLLFDLTSLQKDASNRFGFSARRTLQLAQECYERHKVLTYPRTDSKFLPNDYVKIAYRTMGELSEKLDEFADIAKHILDKKLIKPSKRVFDGSKVSDHFAIIPTGRVVTLTGDVAKIYTLVVQRFLSIFLPSAEYEDTDRTSIIKHAQGEDLFHSHGRVLRNEGWKIVYRKSGGRAKKEELCLVDKGEIVLAKEVSIRDEMTKPPAAYSEATLLGAMESAGKLVVDDELSQAMKERGLGTPATRAAIIEGLIAQEYIVRDGKELIATRRGMDLIDLLGTIGLSTLSSPELTGEWEYRLKLMEQGKLDRDIFMKDVREYTTEIVEAVRDFMKSGDDNPDVQVTCAACGTVGLNSRMDAVSCPQCKFRVRRAQAGMALSDELIAELIEKRELPIMDGFRSRFGKPFKAGLRLVEGPRVWKVEFFFEDDSSNSSQADKLPQTSLGMLLVKDVGELEVFENEKQWLVPAFDAPGSNRKGFSITKTILSRALEFEHVKQLLADGKTELITAFVSQRTRRPFDAFLVLDAKKGKIGFEFPPRAPRGAGDGKSTRFTKADAAAADLSEAKNFGIIPIKGNGKHELLESKMAWHVPTLIFGKARRALAIPLEMCNVKITDATVKRLLQKGKSELIKEFVSSKTGKNFEAFLTFAPLTGKISYEFPERDE